MEPRNATLLEAQYGDKNFLDACEGFLERKQGFIVVGASDKLVSQCRRVASLLLELETQRLTRWERGKIVAKLSVIGMRRAPLVGICIRALHRNLNVTVLKEGNQILKVSPQ